MTKASTAVGLLDFLTKHGSSLPEETVHVKEWKRDVVLRGLSSRERDLFEEDNVRRARMKTGNGKGFREDVEPDLTNFRARLVCRHIVEGGMRVMANTNGEELLGEQPAAVIDPLFAAAQRLSGFSPQDIEELSGNSKATAASAQDTASRPSSGEPSPSSTPH